jgi:hypothetical protein
VCTIHAKVPRVGVGSSIRILTKIDAEEAEKIIRAETAFARWIEKTLELPGENVVVADTIIGAEADRRIAVGRAIPGQASRLGLLPENALPRAAEATKDSAAAMPYRIHEFFIF